MMAAAWMGKAEVIRILLAARAEVDRVGGDARAGCDVALPGVSSLMCACRNGHSDAARVLLKAMADPMLTDAGGDTALHWAIEWGGHELAVRTLLQQGVDVNIGGSGGRTPLLLACVGGHPECVAALLQAGATAAGEMVLASQLGHEDVVRVLVERKRQQAGAFDADEEDALAAAQSNGHHSTAILLAATLGVSLRRRAEEARAEGSGSRWNIVRANRPLRV